MGTYTAVLQCCGDCLGGPRVVYHIFCECVTGTTARSATPVDTSIAWRIELETTQRPQCVKSFCVPETCAKRILLVELACASQNRLLARFAPSGLEMADDRPIERLPTMQRTETSRRTSLAAQRRPSIEVPKEPKPHRRYLVARPSMETHVPKPPRASSPSEADLLYPIMPHPPVRRRTSEATTLPHRVAQRRGGIFTGKLKPLVLTPQVDTSQPVQFVRRRASQLGYACYPGGIDREVGRNLPLKASPWRQTFFTVDPAST